MNTAYYVTNLSVVLSELRIIEADNVFDKNTCNKVHRICKKLREIVSDMFEQKYAPRSKLAIARKLVCSVHGAFFWLGTSGQYGEANGISDAIDKIDRAIALMAESPIDKLVK